MRYYTLFLISLFFYVGYEARAQYANISVDRETNTVLSRSGSTASFDTKGQFIFLFFGDTNDKGPGGIGESVEVSRDLLTRFFRDAARQIDYDFVPMIYDGDKFTRKNINKSVDGLVCTENSVVVAVYSGHGFTLKGRSSDHGYLKGTSGRRLYDGEIKECIKLDDLYARLKSKGAHCTLVFGEYCQDIIGSEPDDVTGSFRSPAEIKNAFETLFLKKEASIIMSSSSQGESSWGNNVDGGYFINGLLIAIQNELGKGNSASWKNIAKNTVENTRLITEAAVSKGLIGNVQNPQWDGAENPWDYLPLPETRIEDTGVVLIGISD
jgi:hypothetical protein